MKEVKVPLFTVLLREDPRISFTVTKTKEEAFEYVNRKVRHDHSSHFVAWCDLHNYKADSPEAWNSYKYTVLSKEDFYKYKVQKIKFPFNKILSIMRIYFGYLPLGCSFDDPMEIETILKAVGPETAQKIQQQIAEEEEKQNANQ